jgi:hypothetical protein
MEILSDYFFALSLTFSVWKVTEVHDMTTLRCDVMAGFSFESCFQRVESGFVEKSSG